MSLMNFAKMLKSQKYHMILMFSMDMARKSQKYQLSKKLRETTVPNDNYDYILSKTNRSSHMSLMNFTKMLKFQKYHMVLMFSMDMAKKS